MPAVVQQLQLDVLRLAASASTPLSQTLLANALLVLLAPLPPAAAAQVPHFRSTMSVPAPVRLEQ